MLRSLAFGTVLFAGMFSPDPPPVSLAKINATLLATSDRLNRLFTPPKEHVEPISPAAARVDEDLDYHIAARTNSIDAWQAFLAAHPQGPHAAAARAAIEKFQPAPAAVEVTLDTTAQQLEFFRMMERQSDDAPGAPEAVTIERIVEVPDTRTIVKWRERRIRYVVHWHYARPRYYRPAPPPSLFTALFGQPRPRR
jgi:hypothetical protein